MLQIRRDLGGHSKPLFPSFTAEETVICPRPHCIFDGIFPLLGKSLSFPNWEIQHSFLQELLMLLFSYSILT